MPRVMLLTAFAVGLIASPAIAQNTTTVAKGTAVSGSSSKAKAVSISGGGRGGNSSLTIAAQPATTTSNINQNVSGTTTQNQNVSGTQTIRSAPGIVAPGLNAAGLETCLGAVSGGGSVVGFGASFGTTVPDPGCAARLDARTLWSMGLKSAAVARLCLTAEIQRSMPDICERYLPRLPAPAPSGFGFFAAAAPAPYVAGPPPAADAEYTGGPIVLIEGRTGEARLCADYDVARARCRAWASRPKVAAAKPQRPMKSKPAAPPALAPAVTQEIDQ